MVSYEPQPEVEADDRAELNGESAAETNGQASSELQEIKSRFEDKLNSFSRQMLGRVNYCTSLIETRQGEIDQLEAEVAQSAQGLSRLEDEFEGLGGSGRLTPQIIDRAEVVYNSYLVEHRSRQSQAADSEAQADDQDPSRHPGLVTEAVSYRDFLLYGILRLDTPQVNGQDQTEPVNNLLQPLTIQPPKNIIISHKEKQMSAYIPSFNQEEFDQLKQDQDPSNSSLLISRLTEHGDEGFGWPIFGFGAYQPGQLDRRDPAVKRMVESAVDHMVLKKDSRVRSNRFKTDIFGARQSLQDIDRKILV